MPSGRHECPTCGGWKHLRAHLCRNCEDEYGIDRDQWPEWLCFLVNDSERETYQDELHARREMPLDGDVSVEDGEVIEWERNGQRGGAGN